MEDKIFDFVTTKDALSQLSADLIELETSLQTKQSSLAKDKEKSAALLAEKEQKISSLTLTIQNTLTNIEQMNHYIEEVL
ncbi:MAG: hypothetical protein MJ210_04955 [Alphaproteobacteria bacterium]|nr:hypothetical protein [Alphaproteobacteria bacterium]